jgi:hypothetical protein
MKAITEVSIIPYTKLQDNQTKSLVYIIFYFVLTVLFILWNTGKQKQDSILYFKHWEARQVYKKK